MKLVGTGPVNIAFKNGIDDEGLIKVCRYRL